MSAICRHTGPKKTSRVVNDNNSLMKQVRVLANENNELQHKLAAARGNVKLADKRIAALEAEYAAAVLT